MKCELVRQQVMDIAYGEGVETAELREHLVSCAECSSFSASLAKTQELLGPLELPDDSGFRAIRSVVVKAAVGAERRRLVRDLMLFALMIVVVFGLYFEIYRRQGSLGLAYLFAAMYLVVPFTLIPLHRRKVAKEEGK